MGLGDWGRDGSLAYLRTAVEKSLRNLCVEAIDLYQYHRPDRWKTYAEVRRVRRDRHRPRRQPSAGGAGVGTLAG